MQSRYQSFLEVGCDLVFAFLFNIGGQVLFYGSVATPLRTSKVATFVIGLAFIRRFVTRRFFNARLPSGGKQPPWHSWVEISVDTLIGFGTAIVIQWWVYEEEATWGRVGGLTGFFYLITAIRRYMFRRLFEKWRG